MDGSHERGNQEAVSLKMRLQGGLDKIRQTIHKEMENKSQNIHETDAVGINSMSTSEERLMDQRVLGISKQCERESKRKDSLQRFLNWRINKITMLLLRDSSGSLIAKVKAIIYLSLSPVPIT